MAQGCPLELLVPAQEQWGVPVRAAPQLWALGGLREGQDGTIEDDSSKALSRSTEPSGVSWIGGSWLTWRISPF